jgi:hypothetical protein
MKDFMKNPGTRSLLNIHVVTGRKIILLLALIIIGITGCRRNSFSVSGRIEGAEAGEYLLLREVRPGLLEPVDSVVPGKDGHFSFRSETEWPAFTC